VSRRHACELYDHAESLRETATRPMLARQLDQAGDAHMRLVEAVEKLLRAAYWHPDRDVDGHDLWEAVRVAAGVT
jgi:hypothetical protein